MESTTERPEEGLFLLPGGYLDPDGESHREVKLRPLTGREEEWATDPAREWTEATLVTALLRRCVERIGPYRPTEEMIRSLSVGDRDYLMLRLRQITFGKRVALTLVCPRPECAERMDLDLDLDQVPVEPKPVAKCYTLGLSDERGSDSAPREVVFRVPNGADQEAARAWSGLGAEERRLRLLVRCLSTAGDEGAIPFDQVAQFSPGVIEEITEAIEARTPQADAEMEARCPECGELFTHRFEAAPFFLNELLRSRGAFEQEVHLLGFYYHWSLREILGLTRQKRRRYLQFLTEELERSGRSVLGIL